ncbi:hypothetical protein BDY24DRAFT_383883 [Mrakia frigida]|uniref:uncharacterized protein n=1 Tax=Mrakia frigida TaxID=29902 RepID=UPI003FCC01CC
MSLVATLESLLLPPSSRRPTPLPPSTSSDDLIDPPSPIRVYGPRGLRFGLRAQVLSKLGIYNPPNVLHLADEVLRDVDAGWEGQGADVVVLPTAEIDMDYFSEALWKIWEARPADRKFSLVCIPHDTRNRDWIKNWSAPWVKANALKILTISGSVSEEISKNFIFFADEPDRHHLGYAEIPVEAHIPMLPIERLPGFNAHGRHSGEYLFSKDKDGLGELRLPTKDVDESLVLDKTWGRRDGKVLRDVAIQGTFASARRNYKAVMIELEAEIARDPEAWGYLPSADPSASFIPASSDNFVLHLVGHAKPDFEIPPRLQQHVVKLYYSLSYPDFFSMMGSMDLVLPAFTPRGGYYDGRASSTVAMAMQCETPLLVTPRIFRAYSYLTPETTILRPQTISEITAIKTLRTSRYDPPPRRYDRTLEGIASEGDASVDHPSIRRDAEEMIRKGWVTKEEDWRRFKRGIVEANKEVVRKVILES